LNHVPGDAINPLRPVELDATPDFTSAFGSTADITVLDAGLVSVENDPGCVKTPCFM
jgi:hypothetical protein